MAYTVESLQPIEVGRSIDTPSQFNLPSKEFVGYDPKGTTSITGSPLVNKSEVVQPTEPAAAPVPEVPAEETVILSPKVSAIARKEQALRQKEKLLLQKEKEQADKLAKAEKYEQLKAKIANKDYSALDEEGVAYEEYVKHELNKEASKDPATERVRKIEEELASLKKAQEEQAIKDYENNQNLWKQEIARIVKEGDEFSTIRELNAEHLVLQHVNDSFEEDNVELTAEQAAKDIEEALLQRAEKFASLSKIKNKAPDAKVLGAPKPKVTTITQNMTTTSAKPVAKPFHLMSESEQIAEAYRRVQEAKLKR
jgi:hypothetical protein